MAIATSGERSDKVPTVRTKSGSAVLTATASGSPDTAARTGAIASSDLFLVNAAFLQEIKDSNTPLWHQVHDLRTCCEANECGDQSAYQTMKGLVAGLSDLRDLLALQFSLEESYGFVRVGSLPPGASRRVDERAIQDARRAIDQHRRLYLQVADLVEAGEELQYRGCQRDGLQPFIGRLEVLLRELTAHERLEAELIGATRPELAGGGTIHPPGPSRRRTPEADRTKAPEAAWDQPSPLDG